MVPIVVRIGAAYATDAGPLDDWGRLARIGDAVKGLPPRSREGRDRSCVGLGHRRAGAAHDREERARRRAGRAQETAAMRRG
jgi:hypothetical protein